MTKLKWLVVAAGWLIILCLWIGMAIIGYDRWQASGQVVVTNFMMDTPKVRAGEMASYTVDFCVDGQLPLQVSTDREFVSLAPQIHSPITPSMSFAITKRCNQRRMFLAVPAHLPAGLYRLVWYTQLNVNLLRTVTQSFESVNFEVVK
jgi:hypothetical protein